MIERLMAKGLTRREAEELISIGEDVEVIEVFNSEEELGQYYVDNIVESLDYHIEAILDLKRLGAEIADTDDEYETLSTGRIVRLDL